MKTIAQQLKAKEFPFIIRDSKGNEIYREYSNGYWYKKEYDSMNNQIYYEDSNGNWSKREFDSMNNQIYYENSGGGIVDYRSKELTMDEIAAKFNIPVSQLKIKK